MKPKPISQASNNQLQVLGWYQIIGGVVGLKVVFDQLWSPDGRNGVIFVLCLIALGLFCFSIYCGRMLLGRNYENGLALTFFNQALQIFSFTAFGFGYMYYAGIMFQVHAHYWHQYLAYNKGADFGFKYLSNWRLHWNTGSSLYEFGVNFVAIYLSYFSYRLYKQVRMERQYAEANYVVSEPAPATR